MSPRISPAQILNPRSIAVIGASDAKEKFGGRVMYYLVRHRFGGKIYPVNPRRDQIFGLPAYTSIRDVPGPVDVAMLTVPPGSLLQAVNDCAEAGVGACVIMTTGFAEADAAGAEAQAQIVHAARGAGMRIMGPNCMGLINPLANCALTSSLVLDCDELLRGRIGLISQSGALMVSMFNKAQDSGIGFSACVSLGNQSDLEICDFLEYQIDDENTDAICLYVEGFADAPRFLKLAARSRDAGKRLIMVKTGRTPEGVRAARSHTASLAGSYEILRAACRDLGVVLTDDPDGMVRLADVLVRWPDNTGTGIGILSPSGGGAGLAVDRVSEGGLELALVEDQTKQHLLEILLPPQADNPIDLGGRRSGDSVEAAGEAVRILTADPNVSMLLVVLTTVPSYEATTHELGRAALASGKPALFVVTPGSAADGPRRVLSELGCCWFNDLDQALRVLDGLKQVVNGSRSAPQEAMRPPSLPAAVKCRRSETGLLSQSEVKTLLARYAIPMARERMVKGKAEAIEAAREIGFPVALKIVSRDIIHKTDSGGVVLGIADAESLGRSWQMMTERFSATGAVVDGFLVQEMAQGGAELIVGVRRDEQYGPILLVGFGGIFAEILNDVQIALAPVSPEQASVLLRRLQMWPLLAGARGRIPLDVESTAQLASRLSWLAFDLGEVLTDLELNPILVRNNGQGTIAVDARATITSDSD